MNASDLLAVLAVLGTGTTAGVLFGVALSVTPALIAMPVGVYIDVHKKLGQRWDPTMPIIVLSTSVLHVTLALLTTGHAVVLHGFAAALMLGVAAVSHLANVPINRRVKGLEADEVPDDWDDPRKLWRNWNLLRTVFAGFALLASALAVTVPTT